MMMMIENRTDDGRAQARADVSVLGYRPSDEGALYPHNMAGTSSGFRYQDLQFPSTYQAKVQALHPKQAAKDAERSVAPVREERRASSNEAAGYFSQASLEQIVLSVVQQLLAAGATLPMPAPKQGIVTIKRNTSDASAVVPADLGLTPRETEVLRILLQGKSNKTISRELRIAESTVKVHAHAVYRKLNVGRRTEAMAAATRMGLTLETN